MMFSLWMFLLQLTYSHGYFLKFPNSHTPVVCLCHSVMEWSLPCTWNNKSVIKNNILMVIKLTLVTNASVNHHLLEPYGTQNRSLSWWVGTLFLCKPPKMSKIHFFLCKNLDNRRLHILQITHKCDHQLSN